MVRKYHYIFFGMLLCSGAWSAEDFGRLFTTPGQRQQLDELRRTQTDIKVDVQDTELAIDKGPAVQKNDTGELRLKGLVHRNNGKNTAWVNESNSYEGDLASEYTSVKEDSIANDKVTIEIGGRDSKNLPLKVGQSFNPSDGMVHDLIPDGQSSDKTISRDSGKTKNN